MATPPIPPDVPPPLGRRRPRRLLVVALLALAAVVLATGGYFSAAQVLTGRHATVALATSQVFHWAADGHGAPDVGTLDPDQAYDALSEQLTGLIFDRLVILNASMRVEDWAARSVAVSPDGMVYTFWLRPGQRFSNGTPVRASDYAYSLDRALNPCFQSPISYFLLPLRDAQSFSTQACINGQIVGSGSGTPRQTLIGDAILPDDGAGVLTLLLAQPAAYFLDALATGPSAALDHQVVTGANLGQDDHWSDALALGTTGQGGSGMFYVARWDHQGTLILKANPYWWGNAAGKRPHLSEIDLHIFSDPLTANLSYTTSLDASAYDYTDTVPGPQIAGLTPSDLHHVPLLQVETIAFNWRLPPFNNLDARQAFCLAINRDALVNGPLHGGAIPTWHLVPQGMPGYNPALTGIDGVTATSGNLAAARAHWAAYFASLHGQPIPVVDFNYRAASQEDFAFGNDVMAQWRRAFPGIRLVTYQPPEILKEGIPPIPAFSFGWTADYPDPQDMISIPYGSKSIFNLQSAAPPAADSLLARADALYRPADQSLRLALYAQAEQELIQQVAVCPIYQGEQFYRLRSYVHGCAPDALDLIPADTWVSCFIARH